MKFNDAKKGMLLGLIDPVSHFSIDDVLTGYGRIPSIPYVDINSFSVRKTALGPRDSITIMYLGAKAVADKYDESHDVVCTVLINGEIARIRRQFWQYMKVLK